MMAVRDWGRTAGTALVVVVLLLLDWAALHDIVQGEPDPHLEYGMLVVSVFVFSLLIWETRKRRRAQG